MRGHVLVSEHDAQAEFSFSIASVGVQPQMMAKCLFVGPKRHYTSSEQWTVDELLLIATHLVCVVQLRLADSHMGIEKAIFIVHIGCQRAAFGLDHHLALVVYLIRQVIRRQRLSGQHVHRTLYLREHDIEHWRAR